MKSKTFNLNNLQQPVHFKLQDNGGFKCKILDM